MTGNKEPGEQAKLVNVEICHIKTDALHALKKESASSRLDYRRRVPSGFGANEQTIVRPQGFRSLSNVFARKHNSGVSLGRGNGQISGAGKPSLWRQKFRKTRGLEDWALQAASLAIVTLFAACCLAPFLYVFSVSFMSYEEYLTDPLRLIPSRPDLTAYKQILDYALIHSGYRVTAAVTVMGTALSVMLLVISAYPLSKKDLKGRGLIMGMIIFTMFFNGGMIPNYLLVRGLGIHNTVFALVLPGCVSAFNLILMRNFVKTSVPVSLEEAAKIDGANELRVLFSVMVPLLKPAIATMTIFSAVNYWNSYFSAIMYISDRKLWPLILVLRELVVENTDAVSPVTAMLTAQAKSHPFTIKMAAIVIVILPILAIYPFMQQYFVKGISLGSVKE
ncbi:MAG: carbohydrate ABC transporter permease [Clostridiales bacterium]|nr:carbohydrate ABC transporter permease [Clostridiales bacterium]